MTPKANDAKQMTHSCLVETAASCQLLAAYLLALTLFYYHQGKIGHLLTPEFLRILADYLVLHAASRHERGPLLYSQLLECVQYLF